MDNSVPLCSSLPCTASCSEFPEIFSLLMLVLDPTTCFPSSFLWSFPEMMCYKRRCLRALQACPSVQWICLQAPSDLRRQLPAPPPFEPAQQLLRLFLLFVQFFPFDVDPLKHLLNLLQYCFCFTFCFFNHKAYEILTPQPGIEFAPPAWGGNALTTGLPEKSLFGSFVFFPSADHRCPRAKSDLSSYSSWALSSVPSDLRTPHQGLEVSI